MLDPTIGWTLIMVGIIMVMIEIMMPGQTFLIVAGAFFLTLGLIALATGDEAITFGPIGLGTALTVTVVAAFGTLYVYRKLGKVEKPTTTVAESLIGMKGVVTKKIVPNTISGKVMIGTTEWSARSQETVDKGRHVEVVDSKGVHVVVEEIEAPKKRKKGSKARVDFELDDEDVEDY